MSYLSSQFNISNDARDHLKRLFASALILATILSPIPFTPASADEEVAPAPIEEVIAETPAVVETPAEIVAEPAPQEETTAIVTGDAQAESTNENEVNTNIVQTEILPEAATSTASTTLEIIPEDNPVDAGNSTTTIGIANSNDATVLNDSGTDAGTGSNEIADSENAAIDTGDAVAVSDTVNVVNTNVVNSELNLTIVNAEGGEVGDIDIRPATESMGEGADSASSCTQECLSASGYNVTNENEATVVNDIVVSADTGANSATSSDTALIITGDAYAVANVVNVVNTNITESDLIFFIFNHFGNWDGNLIFPGEAFMNWLLSITNPDEADEGAGGISAPTSILNENTAVISNEISTEANTGDNSSTGGEGIIATGDAQATTNSLNIVNANHTGGSVFSLLVNIYGNWNKTVYNLPEGLTFEFFDGGFLLSANMGGGGPNTPPISVLNSNSANVANNISTSATTGGNSASADGSQIITGDAYAATNLVNIINTNIFSQNWLRAIVNVFGDWDGYLTFGEPDLWVGAVAEGADTLVAGQNIRYRFTIVNRGDAPAHNVVLKSHFDKDLIRFTSILGQSDISISLGDLPARSATEVFYDGYIVNGLPEGDSQILGTFKVTGDQPDAHEEDNTDSIVVTAINHIPAVTAEQIPSPLSAFQIKKTADVETILPGGTVNYKITINNNGKDAQNSILKDTIKDQYGNVVSEREWVLDTIYLMEEVNIEYAIEFSKDVKPGIYKNYAQVVSDNGSSAVAEAGIIILLELALTLPEVPIQPEVAGVFTETMEAPPVITREKIIENADLPVLSPDPEPQSKTPWWRVIAQAIKKVLAKVINPNHSIVFAAFLFQVSRTKQRRNKTFSMH